MASLVWKRLSVGIPTASSIGRFVTGTCVLAGSLHTYSVNRAAQCHEGNTKPLSFADIKQRLLKVNTAALADADKERLRVMDARLRPIQGGPTKFVGIAHTVQCYNDFLTVVKALDDSSPGEVLVIDTQGSTRTVVGELFGTESIRRGIEGIVLDGPCRDTAQLAKMAIPVFITGVRPISGTSNRIYKTQIPVNCGGVVVNPGDIIFGDDDGVIVCSLADMLEILPIAEGVVAAEDELLRGMHSGISLLEQLNFKEHYAAVKAGDGNSKLKFKGASG
eukprot:m.11875 g.11875  ORF g.11875 m.11875 type:complete len:277 (-) comp9023_c0_seq1:72-902(-)